MLMTADLLRSLLLHAIFLAKLFGPGLPSSVVGLRLEDEQRGNYYSVATYAFSRWMDSFQMIDCLTFMLAAFVLLVLVSAEIDVWLRYSQCIWGIC